MDRCPRCKVGHLIPTPTPDLFYCDKAECHHYFSSDSWKASVWNHLYSRCGKEVFDNGPDFESVARSIRLNEDPVDVSRLPITEETGDYIIYKDERPHSTLYGFHCKHHQDPVDKCSWNQEDVKHHYCHRCDTFYEGTVTKSIAKRLKVQLRGKLSDDKIREG